MSVIDGIDAQLLSAYDKFLLGGGNMQLEAYREISFRELPKVDDEPLLPYYKQYIQYRTRTSTNVMPFSSFVRKREALSTAPVSIKEEEEQTESSSNSENYETILPKFQDKIREYLEAVRMKQSDTDESCAIFKFIEQNWSQSKWKKAMESYVRSLMQYIDERDMKAFGQRKRQNIQEVTDLMKQLGYDEQLAEQYWEDYQHCNTNLLLTAVNSPEDVVMFKLKASECKAIAQTFGLFLDIGRDYKKSSSSSYVPSAVRVETELLKKWQEQGVSNMNTREEDALVRSMRELCRASDWKSLRAANRFDASNPPSVSSACTHNRHSRLRHTQRLETAHSSAMADDGRPMHLVIYRVPSTGTLSRELVHSSELDPQHMIVYHSYISSKGLLNWLKGKVTRYTGAALPKGLKEYFQDSENFAAAVAVAEEVFLDESGKERARPEAEAKIRKLLPDKRDLLYALTQYMCYIVKQGKVRSMPSGANSIQAMHALVSRCTRHELRNPSDIFEKVQKYGYGSLTRSERQRLLTAMSPSSANARQLTAPPNIPLPEIKTGEQWKVQEVRELLINSVLLYNAQVKQGIALAPAQPLRDIDSSRSTFIKDLRATIDARSAEQGIGLWLIPTDSDYSADSHRDDTPEYFSHFFVDMSPSSSLGKLNRAALREAEKEEDIDSITLLTDAGTRVESSELFPDLVLRDDFHQRLFAFLADVVADPETDLTLAFQIQVIPDSLFDEKM